MVPWGWMGPQWRNPFLHMFIGENLSSQEPLSQKSSNLHRSFLIKCRIKFVKVMAPGGLGLDDITKCMGATTYQSLSCIWSQMQCTGKKGNLPKLSTQWPLHWLLTYFRKFQINPYDRNFINDILQFNFIVNLMCQCFPNLFCLFFSFSKWDLACYYYSELPMRFLESEWKEKWFSFFSPCY
jgi:hypothetical protein